MSHGFGFKGALFALILFSGAAANAQSLTFSRQPSASATVGANWVTPPGVSVLDSRGRVNGNATNAITIQAFTNSTCTVAASAGAVTVSPNPKTASRGVANFDSARAFVAGTFYLRASSGSLRTACSRATVVSAAPAPEPTPVPTPVPTPPPANFATSFDLISGSSEAPIGSCQQITARAMYLGSPAAVAYDTAINLSAQHIKLGGWTTIAGALHSNSSCSSPVSSVTIPNGGNSATFWVRSDTARTVRVSAQAYIGWQQANRQNEYVFYSSAITAGSWDFSFGINGRVNDQIPTGSPYASLYGGASVVMADGRLLNVSGISGVTSNRIVVSRYFADGRLDSSFGSNGRAYHNSVMYQPREIALRADGKIMIFGTYSNGATSSTFSMARLNSDGSLDTSFGNMGWANHSSLGGVVASTLIRPVLQADGKILAAGSRVLSSSVYNTSYGASVVRFNENGSLDTTFGNSGVATVALSNVPMDMSNAPYDHFRHLAVQADGRIVAVGSSSQMMGFNPSDAGLIVRFSANGQRDLSFGSSGARLIMPSMTYGRQGLNLVRILADGRIAVAGTGLGAGNIFVSAFSSSGSLDTTFGNAGQTLLGVASFDVPVDIAAQSDGKIVVLMRAIYNASVNQSTTGIARLNSNGAIDTSFSSGLADAAPAGHSLQYFPLSSYEGLDLALTNDGKILVSGFASTNSVGGIYLMRLWN